MGYRFVLPSLPTHEALKECVFLHCDVDGRPYRIDDFRAPLEEIGLLKAVVGIGPYQMGHVWLLKLRTLEDKEALVRAGTLEVKGRYCVVIDPVRREITAKIHWIPFYVPNEELRKVLSEFGEVMDIRMEEWKASGFELAESTTRIARIALKEGVTPDSLPDLFRFVEGAALVVVPGRAPTCLRCRLKGHIRRDCQTPRCSKCRAFGHEREDCVRTYAVVAGSARTEDDTKDLMDEEEAEKAVASGETTNDGGKQPPTNADDEGGETPNHGQAAAKQNPGQAEEKNAAVETTAAGDGLPQGNASPKAKMAVEDGKDDAMDAESASAKRRRDKEEEEAVGAQRLRQLEREWLTATGKKGKYVRLPRASSLPRGDRALSQESGRNAAGE